ncbi:MAG TPA: hypothetical protein VL326_30835 [Kofleriaceae bacterium]|nr:hypothetical protein [Kofleriaceae bacterium]
MVREFVPLAIAALVPGCSLILDFSDSAAPHDAAIDAVYTQEQCDYLEPNDTIDTALAVTAADNGTAAICAPTMMGGAEDHDFYKFTVATVPFTVGIVFTNRPGGDLDMKVYNASDNTLLGQSRGFGDGEMLTCPGNSPTCPNVSPGDFIVEVFPAVGGAVNTYTLALP